MSLHTNCEAIDQILSQYIKYYSSFDHFHVSTLSPKPYNFDLSKHGFKSVGIWLRSSIAAAGQIVFLYKNCEATDERLPWYIKYYSSFDHLHVSTTTPKISEFWSIKTWFQAIWGLTELIHSCSRLNNVYSYQLWGYGPDITSIYQIS